MRANAQSTPRRALRMRLFFVSTVMAVALLVFLAITLITSLTYERAMMNQAEQTASAVAHQTFASMFSIMREGWTREQLESFAQGIQSSLDGTPLQLDLYRGEKVAELYGQVAQPPWHQNIEKAFKTGNIKTLKDTGELRYTFPLRASSECLGCHRNASSGDVLGVLEVRQDLAPVLGKARGQHLWTFFGTGLGTLALTVLIVTWSTGPITRSLRRFRDHITRIHTVQDLDAIEPQILDTGFAELNQMADPVNELLSRLRTTAVDKSLLEFERKLLDRLVITSDVAHDWPSHFERLLTEIHSLVESCALFTLFRTNDEACELDIFWSAAPTANTRSQMEQRIKARLQVDGPPLPDQQLMIRHTITNPQRQLPEWSPETLELATRSLQMETPRIGIAVGIGTGPQQNSRAPLHPMTVRTILSTMLNLFGSARAIGHVHQELEHHATHDPLTQLYNQGAFWERLDHEIQHADDEHGSFAVMVVDLDNFKTLNDRYGHAFGDRVLQAYAELLQKTIRPEDFLARHGGDKFTLILPQIHHKKAWQLARALDDSTKQLMLQAPDGSRIRATICIGIALYPDHGCDSRDLFLVADNMMYKAKREGKNTTFLPGPKENAAAFHATGEVGIMILDALEDRRIEPYFQAITEIASGEIPMYELLMRIRVGENWIPAAQFIEVAETLGVMRQLDQILIEKAFSKVQEFDYPGMLFINLSPRTLTTGEFVDRVSQLARTHAIAPERIVFEITERDTVKNVEVLIEFVKELKQQNFHFAIDDFGSGFSSFHYLKHLPIDFIKIEGTFVRNLVHDRRDWAFVRSITALAHDLGVRTIAEFVEDQETLEAVQSIGIHYAQGFYLGHPGPQLGAPAP